jgi:K+-sensing histidine kinase KdpD
MRNELLSSFTAQWRAQEDRKLLNAAFAHDIRTPLTVLKGQVDVLLRNLKMDRASQETVIDTLNLLARHIGFIENHTDYMSTLQRLEEIHIYKKEMEWNNFWPIMQKSLEQLAANGGKRLSFECNIHVSRIDMDDAIITRILENVITNAVRYAKDSVVVTIGISEAMVIKVYDDGPGFSVRALEHALEPFYHEGTPTSEYRSDGLGLFICKTLVEKYGGSIVLANGLSGGGEVTLSFYSNKRE